MVPIYFVLPEAFRKDWSPKLREAAKGLYSVEEVAPCFQTGVDVFLLQAWMLLCRQKTNYSFHLVEKAVKNEICVFHYDTARIKYGLLDCFSIVIRVDRPSVPYADIVVEQCSVEDRDAYYIPHWVHPGLLPRAESRGERFERLAIVGNTSYHPRFLSEPEFIEQLKKLGIELVVRGPESWTDFRDIDAVFALRPWISQRVLETKPPIKLLNAWAAGTPALLGPEPSYRALRSDPLDYLEIDGPKSLLESIQRIKAESGFYAALRRRCLVRSTEYTWENICGRWIELFDRAVKTKHRSPTKIHKAAAYGFGRLYAAFLKRAGLWKD